MALLAFLVEDDLKNEGRTEVRLGSLRCADQSLEDSFGSEVAAAAYQLDQVGLDAQQGRCQSQVLLVARLKKLADRNESRRCVDLAPGVKMMHA